MRSHKASPISDPPIIKRDYIYTFPILTGLWRVAVVNHAKVEVQNPFYVQLT